MRSPPSNEACVVVTVAALCGPSIDVLVLLFAPVLLYDGSATLVLSAGSLSHLQVVLGTQWKARVGVKAPSLIVYHRSGNLAMPQISCSVSASSFTEASIKMMESLAHRFLADQPFISVESTT